LAEAAYHAEKRPANFAAPNLGKRCSILGRFLARKKTSGLGNRLE
jgi:hypothetical protein